MNVESSKPQKKHIKKRGVGIYQQNILYKLVTIPFNKIGNNIAELINEMLTSKFEGKCITEGYVKNGSIRLLNYSSGEVRSNNVLFTAEGDKDSLNNFLRAFNDRNK